MLISHFLIEIEIFERKSLEIIRRNRANFCRFKKLKMFESEYFVLNWSLILLPENKGKKKVEQFNLKIIVIFHLGNRKVCHGK